MATTFVSPLIQKANQRGLRRANERYSLLLVSALTSFAVVLHGYHPYAEDGGLYMAGIKRLLDPGMYPHETAFVVEHVRFSLFAPFVAGLVRLSGVRVETVLFLLYISSFWMMLFAAWHLAARCYEERIARTGAVSLLAIWMTLPVAGTSLMLMDPYITARSISTPCALLALVGIVDSLTENGSQARRNGFLLALSSLLIAFLFHPLMAAYALGCAVVLGGTLAFPALSPWFFVVVPAVAGGIAAMIQSLAMHESGAYARVASTRSYWFLSQWHWYEWIGLAAPLAILALAATWQPSRTRSALARTLMAVGLSSILVSSLFVHEDAATHVIARLQPLRVFQLIYAVMILFVGAEAARRLLQRNTLRWAAAFSFLAGVMFVAERKTFPASAHLEFQELVRSETTNPWERAFLWVRRNTPKDALLALDADYIEKPNEDAQCFRAIAERSALPDYSKDGGEASITPGLTTDWTVGQTAQNGLSKKTDEERVNALKPLGVDWVVLERGAVTGFACDYANEAVKVCRMPNEQNGTVISSRSPALQPLPSPR